MSIVSTIINNCVFDNLLSFCINPLVQYMKPENEVLLSKLDKRYRSKYFISICIVVQTLAVTIISFFNVEYLNRILVQLSELINPYDDECNQYNSEVSYNGFNVIPLILYIVLPIYVFTGLILIMSMYWFTSDFRYNSNIPVFTFNLYLLLFSIISSLAAFMATLDTNSVNSLGGTLNVSPFLLSYDYCIKNFVQPNCCVNNTYIDVTSFFKVSTYLYQLIRVSVVVVNMIYIYYFENI